MSETAPLLTAGRLGEGHGKTAHGLIRGPSRFDLVGAVDPMFAGRDAGKVFDDKPRGLPIFATLDEALEALGQHPDWLVVGVAFHGGRMPEEVRQTILAGVRRGIGVVNGLHQLLSEDPEVAVAAAAAASGTRIVDLRKPKKVEGLRFWSGEALTLTVPRVAVLGTDCALGKRTTATFLATAVRERGIATELVYVGQTGCSRGSATALCSTRRRTTSSRESSSRRWSPARARRSPTSEDHVRLLGRVARTLASVAGPAACAASRDGGGQ